MVKRLMGQVILYLFLCVGCRRGLFAICESCYRGQRYCGRGCSRRTRLGNHRTANRIHQDTFNGRMDHARRQAAYRERWAQAQIVTDQGSQAPTSLSTVPGSLVSAMDGVAVVPNLAGSIKDGWLVCMVCGQAGPVIDSPRGGKRDQSRNRKPDPAGA